MRMLLSVVTISLLCALACRAEAGERELYRWKGKVGVEVLRLRNISGGITVERAPGKVAEVVAVLRWRGAEPEGLHVMRAVGPAGMSFCVLWPARGHRCSADGDYDHRGDLINHGASVHLLVRAPAGTALDLSTVNGNIDAALVGAELEARTVNGSIGTSLGRRTLRAGRVELETVNGSIRVDAPAPLDAELSARTVHGSIRALGRRHRQSLDTRLGDGGLRLRATTVNGSIRIDAPQRSQSIPMRNGCPSNLFHLGIIQASPCLPSVRWLSATA